ncbi:ABC transporter permease [Dactylosporangium sp. NPDC000555]|uniref:ABC transporter permease n=1 Tax=Dactylosporangium sp. NPDC000555 TaxID=3154260 RepID=UPI00331EE89A
MLKFILVKLTQALVSVFGASIIVFLLARASGDPVNLMVSANATTEEIESLRATLGLDRSLLEQYLTFLSNALRGDFGQSIHYHRPAVDVVMSSVGATLMLGSIAFLVTVLLAVPAGVYAAARRDGRFDRCVRGLAAAAQALPSPWVGTLLILLFSVTLGVLPTSGSQGWQSFILPVTTLVIFAIAGLLRLTRSSMLETLGTEYVRFARVKGVSERAVLWRHAFRNASLSVLTLGALVLLSMLSGSIIVETVFGWPGIGRAVVQAVNQRDFPVVQVIVLFMSVAYIMGNFVVDVLYACLNPRIRSA